VGFETTSSVFERAETAHALDRSANVIDKILFLTHRKLISFKHQSVNGVIRGKAQCYLKIM
jgi:hypothetical protein